MTPGRNVPDVGRRDLPVCPSTLRSADHLFEVAGGSPVGEGVIAVSQTKGSGGLLARVRPPQLHAGRGVALALEDEPTCLVEGRVEGVDPVQEVLSRQNGSIRGKRLAEGGDPAAGIGLLNVQVEPRGAGIHWRAEVVVQYPNRADASMVRPERGGPVHG